MLYNNIDMTQYMRIIAVRGRGITERELTTVRVIGSDEDYVTYRTKPPRFLEIDFEIRAKNKEELRKKIDAVSAIIETTEKVPIVFPDEPDLTYYGEYAGVEEDVEYHHVGIHRGTIHILRDKVKYGPEKVYQTDQDTFTVENNGTAEAEPIIELTATQKATFAMVAIENEYNMIGRPAEVDEQLVDEKIVVLDEVGDTIDTWQPAPGFNGTFVHGSQGIQVSDWGSGTGWHGPGAIKEINPIQDFEIEFFIYVRSETPNRTFAISTNFFDEHMNELGMLRLWDNSDRVLRKVVEARVGPYVGDFINYLISSRNYDLRDQRVWGGIIRVTRKGNAFTFYAARITQAGKHVDTITQTFRDVNNEYGGKLKFVRIDIRNYGNTEKPNEVAINRIRVWEHKEVLVDETPYIIYPGDTIEFDHVTKDIRLNGESRKDLKAFGASFFTLKKGINTLAVMPENVFDTKITYRERYK